MFFSWSKYPLRKKSLSWEKFLEIWDPILDKRYANTGKMHEKSEYLCNISGSWHNVVTIVSSISSLVQIQIRFWVFVEIHIRFQKSTSVFENADVDIMKMLFFSKNIDFYLDLRCLVVLLVWYGSSSTNPHRILRISTNPHQILRMLTWISWKYWF